MIYKKQTLTQKIPAMALVLFAGMVLGSCSISKTEDPLVAGNVTFEDPFEDTNRVIFAFNEVVDDVVIHPVIEGYRAVVPGPARQGVRNFLRNLKTPVRFANQLLQGDTDGAGNEIFRGVVNTLVGLGGLFDVAGKEGFEYEPEDFGQTLAVWGVDHGPYIVLPVLGPSSLRDYAGYTVDALADPLRWYLYNVDKEDVYYVKIGADYLDLRDSLMDVLKDLEKSSIDYYAAVRSTYFQNRDAMVKDHDPEALATPDIPDYDD